MQPFGLEIELVMNFEWYAWLYVSYKEIPKCCIVNFLRDITGLFSINGALNKNVHQTDLHNRSTVFMSWEFSGNVALHILNCHGKRKDTEWQTLTHPGQYDQGLFSWRAFGAETGPFSVYFERFWPVLNPLPPTYRSIYSPKLDTILPCSTK